MGIYLNLGCGDNKLPAPWQNHDAGVDICKPLPFADGSVRFIVIEHCVEHVSYYDAIKFFKECFRVLEIGGTLRVTVPSLTQVMNCNDQTYFDWLKEKGWAPTADDRGAMHAMLFCHGHHTAWNAGLMEATLYYCGFPQPQKCELGYSSHPELRGVEGHARVIGERFNAIESITFEAAKFTGDLSTDYDDKFFAMHVGWQNEYNNIAEAMVLHLPEFASAVDFGCGNGYIIESLRRRGKDVLGIDGSESARRANPNVDVLDISKPIYHIHTDLVICTEVAEHIPADRADALVGNLCHAAKQTIFFSAAKSGHGGHLHLNEQPRQYWVDKFEKHGFEVDHSSTEKIVAALRAVNKRTWWFAENCFVLHKKQTDWMDAIPMNAIESPVKSVTIDHEVKWESNIDLPFGGDGGVTLDNEVTWSQPKRKIAIVLGGGELVWHDACLAKNFCDDHDLQPVWFAANDMIERFPETIVAVTLHPDKLGGWLTQRANAGLGAPEQVWSHDGGSRASNPHVTNRLRDWGGSVGMFGYVVARHLGHDRVILCGVPMTSDVHFVRKTKWTAVSAFTKAWEMRKNEMLPYCRSLSGGWTGQLFGEPDSIWLSDISRETIAS